MITPGSQPDINLELVFDRISRPRVLGYDSDQHALVYAECDSNCTLAANWGSVALFDVGYHFDYSFSLRVNAQGRPRIAYYVPDGENNVISYAWSNANTLTSAGWSNYTLNYATNDSLGLDLALDSQGRPSIVYATDKLDLNHLTCSANCEMVNPTWQDQFIETGEEMNASEPIADIPGCTPGTWMIDGYPSLSLDTADNPHVSYLAKHGQLCPDWQGNYKILYNAEGLRFARPGGSSGPTSTATSTFEPGVTPTTPVPPSKFHVYLPSVVR